jgi:hypothetical protein
VTNPGTPAEAAKLRKKNQTGKNIRVYIQVFSKINLRMTMMIERSKNNLGRASDEKEAERSPAATSEANPIVEEEKEEAQTAATTATPERPNLRTRYLIVSKAFQSCGSGSGSGSVCVLGFMDPDPDPSVRGTDPDPSFI